MACQFLHNPVHIQIGSSNLSANQDIKQIIEVTYDDQKFTLLIDILKEALGVSKVVIFSNSKKGCEYLAIELKKLKYEAEPIHGDKNQKVILM